MHSAFSVQQLACTNVQTQFRQQLQLFAGARARLVCRTCACSVYVGRADVGWGGVMLPETFAPMHHHGAMRRAMAARFICVYMCVHLIACPLVCVFVCGPAVA